MRELQVACPDCGSVVGTHVKVTPEMFAVVPIADNAVQCPVCDATVRWGRGDVLNM
jgi:endogenous inhibitor of DNA gyrase (YacG/DUF329 family)